jgi:CBS domain containing-hemolysin-like protein
LGELAPKSLALLYPEEVSLWTAGPLILFSRVFAPVIAILNGAAALLIRAIGLQPAHELERVHRPEEIEMLVTQSYQHGLLKEEPVEMIRGIFHLSETMASEVMTPRTELVALDADLTIAEAADVVLEEGYSRYPVYEENVDHIIGMVTARDICCVTVMTGRTRSCSSIPATALRARAASSRLTTSVVPVNSSS